VGVGRPSRLGPRGLRGYRPFFLLCYGSLGLFGFQMAGTETEIRTVEKSGPKMNTKNRGKNPASRVTRV
jgi:hypothetical protein